MYSAKDSLSHRSSHHCMVTRSPNHMWAISWVIVLVRESTSSRAAAPRKTMVSRNVTQPGVLHGTGVELGHEHLVVLPERVTDPEQRVVVVEAGPGHLEHLDRLTLEVGPQRRARMDAQGYAVVLVEHGGVGTGADRDEVGGQGQGLRQLPATRRDLGGGTVAEHQPGLGCGDRDGVGRLEVGLVEAGEDPRRRVEEQVPVDVVLAVGRVDRSVQTLPVAAVGHHRLDLEDVLGREVDQLDPPVDEATARRPAGR